MNIKYETVGKIKEDDDDGEREDELCYVFLGILSI
jgi:hypothetical protein